MANQRRRARRANLLATLTAAVWAEMLDYFGHRCAYCLALQTDPVQEHMIPVVRGGGYTKENIVPACVPCNMAKGTKLLWEMLDVL